MIRLVLSFASLLHVHCFGLGDIGRSRCSWQWSVTFHPSILTALVRAWKGTCVLRPAHVMLSKSPSTRNPESGGIQGCMDQCSPALLLARLGKSVTKTDQPTTRNGYGAMHMHPSINVSRWTSKPSAKSRVNASIYCSHRFVLLCSSFHVRHAQTDLNMA